MHPSASDSIFERTPLSAWWRHAVIVVMVAGFTLLSIVTVKTCSGAPPIPARVVESNGQLLFSEGDVKKGQEVFFKYALMEHGPLWGHGAYLGPDYTAEYLHRLAESARDTQALARHGLLFSGLTPDQASAVSEAVKTALKQNRYDVGSNTLTFTPAEQTSYVRQREEWIWCVRNVGPRRGVLLSA